MWTKINNFVINLEKDNNLFIDNQLIDNINKRFEDLEKKYELIKNENILYKRQIKQNEITIMNLNKRIDLIKKENQINLNKIIELIIKENQKYLNEESPNIIRIENKENINQKESNEILIKDKNNDFIIFKNKDNNLLEDNDINKKSKKKVEENKSTSQKNEKKDNIIEFKGKTLYGLLESKLIKIFTEKSPDIDIDDMNELKKICLVLIIHKIDPYDKIGEFFKNNFINYNELDEPDKENLSIKKIKISDICDLTLLKRIEAKDIEQFIKQFRKKYGITEKDYCDKDWMKLIKKGKKEMEIVQIILKKLKYIK